MDDLTRAVRGLQARGRSQRRGGGAARAGRAASSVAVGGGGPKNRSRDHVGGQGGSARCDDDGPARGNWSWSGRARCGGRTCLPTSATASASISAIFCGPPPCRPPRGRPMSSEKIHPEHLDRPAFIYVRQSTFDQVRHHHESRRRQYDLQGHARTLGWSQVVVIDEDLGKSGATAVGRTGFQRLVAEVSLGHAGAVFGLEVSRLARNNRDESGSAVGGRSAAGARSAVEYRSSAG